MSAASLMYEVERIPTDESRYGLDVLATVVLHGHEDEPRNPIKDCGGCKLIPQPNPSTSPNPVAGIQAIQVNIPKVVWIQFQQKHESTYSSSSSTPSSSSRVAVPSSSTSSSPSSSTSSISSPSPSPPTSSSSSSSSSPPPLYFL